MLELNNIYLGNCVDVMQNINNGVIDMVLTSPPYDDLRNYKGYSFEFEKVANELCRIIKDGAVVVWVVGDSTKNGSETLTSFRQALYFKEIGLNVHDTMIYKKENYVPLTHNRYEQSFEYMFVFSKGKPKTFNPIMIPCKHAGKVEKYGNERRQNYGATHSMRLYKETEYKKTNSEKIAPNIFNYTVGGTKTGHPAAFPDKLASDAIISWSNEKDIIFDPFMGSGTTAIMAKENNRHYIGSEISQEYIDIANARINKLPKRLF